MPRKINLIALPVIIFALVASSASRAIAADPAGPQSDQKQSKAKAKASGSSLTGCVDQQDGNYILVDDKNLNPIANLEASGFPTEGFAKHVGHKVTVRGTSNPGGARPVFKVRSIETISDTCAPQN